MSTRNSYPKLSENNQCLFYDIVGRLACTYAQALSPPSPDTEGQLSSTQCSSCDAQSRVTVARPVWEDANSEALLSIMAELLQLLQIQKRRRTRVAAMLALKRILSHCGNVTHLDLETSGFGQWCLQALRNSMRDLRVAAG